MIRTRLKYFQQTTFSLFEIVRETEKKKKQSICQNKE